MVEVDGTAGTVTVLADEQEPEPTVVLRMPVRDPVAFGLETALALGEFLELDTRVVYDLDVAMPAITAALGRMNG